MAYFSRDKDDRNSEILAFLKKKKYIKFSDISKEVGFTESYIAKLAKTNNSQKITKFFTAYLELGYKIPKDIFFNKDITKEEDIIPYINSFKENAEEEQQKIIDHSYLYTLDDNKKITKYKIIYKKSHIELEINNEVRYRGYIFDKFGAEIIIIVNHKLRKTSSTLILERNEILNAIAPICITSKEPWGDYKRLLYFGIISQKEISDEKVIYILKDNDDTQNQDMRLIISKRINGI